MVYSGMCLPCPKTIGKKVTKIVRWHEGKKISDGKGILDNGGLTDKVINKMQNYYVIAVEKQWKMKFYWHNSEKEKALHSMKNQFLPHRGSVQICLTTKSDIHFVQGNLIVGVNIGSMVAVKIVSHLSICQKLSNIYLWQWFLISEITTYYAHV